MFDTNLEDAAPGRLGRFRVKRWDYYGIWTPDLYASAALAHLGYAGMAFFYLIDFASGRCVERTRTVPLGSGVMLPRNSVAGDAGYDDGTTRVTFAVAPGLRRVDVADPLFDGGRGLEIHVSLACPTEHESIVVATPMAGGRFYHNRKINGLRAGGTIAWGDRIVPVPPTSSLGQLDWGRGIWPYRSHWLWASASGFGRDGRVVGLNLGGGFGDLSHATENAIFIDGKLHKLGQVRFSFDASNYRTPWHMTDEDGRLDVTLQPSLERVARTDLLIIRSEVHQVFGRYRGTVVADNGERLDLDDLPGFAEEHWARW